MKDDKWYFYSARGVLLVIIVLIKPSHWHVFICEWDHFIRHDVPILKLFHFTSYSNQQANATSRDCSPYNNITTNKLDYFESVLQTFGL